MKRKLLMAGLASICVACSATGLAACAPDAPVAQEGTIYQTEVQTFWVGIGKAYMTFEYAEEPETPEDGAVYGYVFNVNVDAGDGYSSWLSGDWSLVDGGSLTLTAEWDATAENPTYLADAESGVAKEYSLDDGVYKLGVSLPSAGVVTFELDPVADKVGEGETPEPELPECTEHKDENGDGKCDICGETMPEQGGEGGEEEAEVQMTLTGKSGTLTGKVELLQDKTWELSISYYEGGQFMYVASGRWTQDTTTWGITLIVEKDDADALAEDSYALSVDYVSFAYSGEITVTIAQVGTHTFALSSATSSEDHFTVTYDLNYDGATGAPEAATTITDTVTGKEYISSAPAKPTREGYKFAGWYTVANPVLENGAASTEYLFGTRLSAFNSAPAGITNDVMEITADTTLYARWVQAVEIDSEEDLKNMANDLTGWYVLTADITLTKEWTPVGGYYGSYEFYEPAWWVYSFRGELDGNGHKISGLRISALEAEDDEISQTEGDKSGTAALIAAAVNCYVHDLTISDADIDIVDYQKAGGHAYVSVLAGFVQGAESKFENCTVENADINVSVKDIWYVSVAGLFGGHWGGFATDCTVTDSKINVEINTETLTGYSYEAVYVGALVGEGYAHVEDCAAKADISVKYNDTRTSGQSEQGAMIYYGGATASSTYLSGTSYEGKISLDFAGSGKAQINIGGVSGYQRYGYIDNCYSKAEISLTKAISGEGKTASVGGILGAFDCTYGLMGTAYFQIDGCRVSNCLDNSVYKVENNATALGVVGSVPLDAVVTATAAGFGVDLTKYTNKDGTLNFFGAFNCVSVRTAEAAADGNGNISVNGESAAYGEAVKGVLGDGWTYNEGMLPVPENNI